VTTNEEHTVLRNKPALQEHLERGRTARDAGDLQSAAEHFLAATREAPRHAGAKSHLAHVLTQLHRFEEARVVYMELLDLKPNDASILAKAALVDVKLGHRDGAREKLGQAEALARDDAQTLMTIAEGFREIGDRQRALDVLKKAVPLTSGPQRARALRALAELTIRDDPAAANAFLEEAIASSPEDPLTSFKLAEAICRSQPGWNRSWGHATGGDVTKAKTILARLVEHENAAWRAKANELLAGISRYEGKWEEALHYLENAAAAEPANLTRRCQIGVALLDLDRLDDAETALRKVVAEDPRNARALSGLDTIAKLKSTLQPRQRSEVVAEPGSAGQAHLSSPESHREVFDWRAELRTAVEIVRNAGTIDGNVVAAASILVKYGVTDVLQPHFEGLQAFSPSGRKVATIARDLERGGLARSAQHILSDTAGEEAELDQMSSVVQKLLPNSDTLLIIFAGLAGQLNVSFSLTRRLLDGAGASEIYVRDVEETRYLGGIVGLGTDFASTTAAIRRIAETSNAKRLLMLGNCHGAPGALRYAVACGAEAVLAIDPRIGRPPSSTLRPVESGRIARAMERIGKPPEIFEVYRNCAVRPQTTLVVDDSQEPFASRAHELGSLSGVTVASLAAPRSSITRELLVRGLFKPVLHEFVKHGRLSAETLASIARANGE